MSAPTIDTCTTAGFAAALGRYGDRPALHLAGPDRPVQVTYADLDARVTASREALERRTPPYGRHLIHLTPAPTLDFVVSWLAALIGGHTVLLAPDDRLTSCYTPSMTYDGGWRPTGSRTPVLHPDLRLLLSTSGSTGSPKLVRLSADNLTSNAAAIADYLELTADDVALTTLPMDYCYGLSVLHSHLEVGASIVLDDRSVTDPGLWERARQHGVTSFAGVPYTFDLLAATGWPELPTLRQVTQAGGRMAADRVRALARQGAREGWDLVVMYGQTEATARMAYLPPHLAAEHPAAVGVPIPGGEIRIDDSGELVYSGPNVMMGYAEEPADLALGPGPAELRTGDLARINSRGLIEIVGRKARFAKIFGQRIDLDRTQQLVADAGHESACAQAVDAEQLVVAVVEASSGPSSEQVARTLAEATCLPAHAIRVVPVESIPRLANGKVDQPAVARLQPHDLQAAVPTDATSADSIALLYARVLGLGVDGVDRGASFVDLGGDSLSYVELSLQLEDRLGRLPADWQERSIAQLAGAADRHRPSRLTRLVANVDTTIVLRALAILLIVGSHTNLWVILGGAHILLAIVGFNFARFQLTDEPPRERVRRVGRAAARIAVPAVLWIGAVAALTGAPGWRSVLLLNDLLGPADWSEPDWYYWFIEVALLLVLGAGLLTALPRVIAFERRHRFAFAIGLTTVALLPRFWATWSSYDGDVIHSSLFIAWLFLAGWAAAVARGPIERVVVSGLLIAGCWGFTGALERDLLITAGTLALVWAPTVPWPRLLLKPTGVIASASLYIYLTHWQIYPWLEDRWPLGGLLASLALGVVVWQVVERLSGRVRRRGTSYVPRAIAHATYDVPAPTPTPPSRPPLRQVAP